MKKADIILAAAVIILSIILIGARIFTRTEGGLAVVTEDGRETGRYSLQKDLEKDISGIYGTNRLVIKDRAAFVAEADCPDKLCVHQKKIRYNGEMIVCLPHRLVIRIESGDAPEVDDTAQ